MTGPIVRIDARVGRLAVHDVAATRRVEATALAALADPSALLRAAGVACGRLALALAPHAGLTCIVAGPGNNGGDGIVAATWLHRRGRPVVLVLAGPAGALPGGGQPLAEARASGVPLLEQPCEAQWTGLARPALVIDALLGIGASRPPGGAIAAAIGRIAAWAAQGARVLAVDVPSGLAADRGTTLGDVCVRADDTLAMLTLKPGLLTGAGGDRAGRLWLATLDAAGSIDGEPATAHLIGLADPSLDRPARRPSQHKGSFGDVAVVGGAPGMQGAAWLAASAAHAAGAGRVYVDLLADAGAGNPNRPELIPRHDWWQGPPEALARAVVVAGCGGGGAIASGLPRLLSLARRLVLDADALNRVAGDPGLLAQLACRESRGLATVLTPHPLEAARLLGSDTAAVQADRLAAAQALAERCRAVVVLKGAGSIVAAPAAPPRIAASGNASLASGGTGDVLAGWIGGRWAVHGPRDEGAAGALDVAGAAVVEHGAAAEPQRPGAIRAADLVEALHRLARGLPPAG